MRTATVEAPAVMVPRPLAPEGRRSAGPPVVLLILGLGVPQLWFKTGFLLLGGDFNVPLDPDGLVDEIAKGWSPVLGFGGDVTATQLPLVVPYYGLFALLHGGGLPLETAERAVFGLVFATSGVSMWFLLVNWLGDRLAATVGALLYMFSPFVMITWHNGNSTALIAYGAAPLWLLALDRLVVSEALRTRTLLALALLAVWLSTVAANPPSVVGLVLLPSIVLVGVRLARDPGRYPLGVCARRLALLGLVTAAVSAWWLLPNLAVHGNGKFSRFSESALSLSPPARSTPVPLADFLTGFGFWGWRGSFRGIPYFDFSPTLTTLPYRFLAAVPLLFAIVALLRRNRWGTLVMFASITWILGTFLAMGFRGPFGLYSWAYDHIPGFVAFRSPYEKFAGAQALAVAVLVSVVLALPRGRGHGARGREDQVRAVAAVAVLVAALITVHPLFTGLLENRREDGTSTYHVRLPNYVRRTATYFGSQPGCGVFYPQRDWTSYVAYTWYRGGRNTVNDLLPCTKFAGNVSAEYDAQREAEAVTRMIEEGQPGRVVADALTELGATHVLVRRDIDESVYGLGPDIKLLERYFRANEPFFELLRFGKWDVLEINSPIARESQVERSRGTVPPVRLRWSALRHGKEVVQIAGERRIVLLQSYDPAWHLSLRPLDDALPVRVRHHEKAQGYANSWLATGDGRYRVELRYRPARMIPYGVIASALALAILVLLSLRELRSSQGPRRERPER